MPVEVLNKYEEKKTKKPKLEIMQYETQHINIAPTSSYTKYEFSGCPEYNECLNLSSSDEIPFLAANTVREFISNNLTPSRKRYCQKKDDKGNQRVISSSQENKEVLRYMFEYGVPNEINKQIKILFPDVSKLFDLIGIEYSNAPKPDYINFFSLAIDDGHNPDAVLFFNNNENKNNKWSGYSVQDFHTGEVMSFGQYLCKYDAEKFDVLMDSIGFKKTIIDISISTTLPNNSITFECDNYPTTKQVIQVSDEIKKVIDKNIEFKQTKIVVTAPTGIGKTSMFYQMAKMKLAKMIIALSYTSQVLQGKHNHSEPDILTGMCGSDRNVPVEGSIFMTYDKAPIVDDNINPEDYIMVVDEAHNLVNHNEFRSEQLFNLKKLAKQCKSRIYVTATPEYINYNDVDLVIKMKKLNATKKNCKIIKYGKNSLPLLANIILNQYQEGTIDVVYIKSKTYLRKLEKIINLDKPSIETYVLHAKKKGESPVYANLTNLEMLTGNGIYRNGGMLFTTNLIVDGVNIVDNKIGNIYLINIKSSTDLIQFPSRFRNGYQNYYVLISGNKSTNSKHYEKKSTEAFLRTYHGLALKQKEFYDKVREEILMRNGIFQNLGHILLKDLYTLLDKDGEISEEAILEKIQEIETRKMCYDFDFIKQFMEKEDFGYNFKVDEISVDGLIETIDKSTLDEASAKFKDEVKANIFKVLKMLFKSNESEILVKDYLKQNSSFEKLESRFNIKEHKINGRFHDILSEGECNKILFKYCVGLEVNTDDLKLIVTYNKDNISSIRRTYHNLKLEAKGLYVQNDDKYKRFIWLRDSVRSLETPVLTKEMLIDLMIDFNRKYGKLYNVNDIRGIVKDLHDIFDVEVKPVRVNNRKEKEYRIIKEWTLDDIRGLKCKF
ncbi:MAG: DEAD/DEAH box helicase family protein [Desulfobacterales bacterium]|nr:DEAD/DEAH box helicase family protein [Desulfobacterales bacterium]